MLNIDNDWIKAFLRQQGVLQKKRTDLGLSKGQNEGSQERQAFLTQERLAINCKRWQPSKRD